MTEKSHPIEMRHSAGWARANRPRSMVLRVLGWVLLSGCAAETNAPSEAQGGSMSTGGVRNEAGSSSVAGGAPSEVGGAPSASGGALGSGGSASPGVGGSAGGIAGGPSAAGGAEAGGRAAGGAAGSTSAGASAAGSSGVEPTPPLDCGAQGWAVENNGPPRNRVNYVILGDGYTSTTVDTTLVSHINSALARRFNQENGEPYGRYRKFVNICVMKSVSQNDGIGNGPTAFDGGNGGDRLAAVNQTKVNDYLKTHVPASFEVDWKAVVLNQALWENTGAALMLWSGAHQHAAGAALHEGGHGFHQLADEYCAKGTGSECGPNDCTTAGSVHPEVNSAGKCVKDDAKGLAETDGKWNLWLGTLQKAIKTPNGATTGLQGTFVGSRYVDAAQYRPSANSMMNSLFGDSDPATSFNSVSREQIIFNIWRAVVPIDSTEPPAGAVTNESSLKVNVIDPAVIDLDWTVDGVTQVNGGTTLDTSSLAAGVHAISVKAYDNASTELVRYRDSVCPSSVTGGYCARTSWKNSQQTVSWTLTKQ